MEEMRRLEIVETNGQAAMNTVYMVLFVVIIMILIPLGFIIVAKTQNQIDTTDLTASQNATLTEMKDDTASNFSFMNMVPFVLIASAVLVAVFGIVAVIRA